MSTPDNSLHGTDHYIGRFAPSPTGPLHFGSLVCAVGSYLDALAHGGHWLLRMEDLDPPREMPGAADRILRSLEAHGLHWHGPLIWQSKRHDHYAHVLSQLSAQSLLYECYCTREEIRQAGGHRRELCRTTPTGNSNTAALRFHCAGATESFDDLWHGHLQQDVREDPILKRRDGLYAYHLGVVVDDIEQGVTHIVRGADLLDCCGVQRKLFRALGQRPPIYGHLPLVMNDGGQKLSKQNHAPALDDLRASENLVKALGFLGFHCPGELDRESPLAILSWAVARWQRHQVTRHNRQLHEH
ncbi:tRNA glutamyl-Q(34) synthetase GluQRS [Microbulbifer aggregans]|uniref:tRNA glutamyl-Q(34) synthetase GluQRS n=1 Tax=Microbulbifer aggregans TaxID=1769779 RepID=UPI001CFCDA4A|nr:tRNA glutamyl-Q(34) synthetase GluQRS [Microbulbifer aggregans]